ncbi:MAG: hypothetical protein GY945_16825 [Rhodobacteraceae bacterium]|nr:hypothetical protein [Paracoccaceae bacterium]
MRIFFWVILTAMLAVYGVMLFWSLPQLSNLSGGVAMFDLSPGGYTFEQAHTILDALGYEGRDFYLQVQHRLDTAYPALLALVLILSFWRLYPRFWAIGFSLLAMLAAGFDYLENAAVAVMLRAGPESLSEAMVAVASRWTVLKSTAVSVAMIVLVVGLALAGWRKWQGRG